MTTFNRIRYTKTQDPQVLQSKNVYHHPSNGGRYRVNLHLGQGKWLILDDASGTIALTGDEQHPHKLKIAARDALASLGIPFQVENRDRKIKTNLV